MFTSSRLETHTERVGGLIGAAANRQDITRRETYKLVIDGQTVMTVCLSAAATRQT